MIKKLLLTLLLFPLSMWGQNSAEDMFINAPAGVFPYLNKITRMDMTDYFKSGSQRASTNRLGGNSRILELSPESIVIEEAENNAVVKQIALDTAKSRGDSVIILISNIAYPATDGDLKVLDTNWQPVKGSQFRQPEVKEWIRKDVTKEQRDYLKSAVPFAMATYKYNPDTHLLTLTSNFNSYLPEEVKEKVKDSLYTTLTYKWNGRKFVPAGKS